MQVGTEIDESLAEPVTRCLIWQPSLPMYHVLHGDGLSRDTFYRYQ